MNALILCIIFWLGSKAFVQKQQWKVLRTVVGLVEVQAMQVWQASQSSLRKFHQCQLMKETIL